ncbi:MAG: site-2 protease family protein, partial [Nanoarchaeota archaeon]
MVSFDLISAIVFYSLLFILIIVKRDKLQFQKMFFPLLYVFLYKGNFGLKFMEKAAQKLRKFWRVYGVLAIITGYIGMIIIIVLLVAITIRAIVSDAAQVSLVIPGIPIPSAPIHIPFWFGMIALVVGVIVHEYSHGILARAYDVKVKSSGFGIFALFIPLIPLAFVEPDEKKLIKKDRKAQISMYAAGTFSNFVVAVISFLLLLFVIAPFVSGNFDFAFDIGVVNATGPVALTGLTEGFRLHEINNVPITNVTDFTSVTENLKPGDNVLLNTDKGEYNVKLGEHPENSSKGYFGIHDIRLEPIRTKERLGNLGFIAWIAFWLG